MKNILILLGLSLIVGCYPPPQKPIIIERERPVYIPQQQQPRRDVNVDIGLPGYIPRPYYNRPYDHRYVAPRPYDHRYVAPRPEHRR
jgi:hypothetical protein